MRSETKQIHIIAMLTGPHKRLIQQTLTEEEQNILFLISIMCKEGLSKKVACDNIMPEDPHAFDVLIDKMCKYLFIFCDSETIYLQTAKDSFEITALESQLVEKILSALRDNIVLQPLDDMVSKRDYFVAARLFLLYLMRFLRREYKDNLQIMTLSSEVVIAFATHAELSYYKNRPSVQLLEDRMDFLFVNCMLSFDLEPSLKGQMHRLLGELYSSIFRYDEARDSFGKAHEEIGDDVKLLLAKAYMYENLAVYSKAFQCAFRAYHLNVDNMIYDGNIEVCLYLAYLCAMCEAKKSSKKWREYALALIGDRTIPTGHMFSIMLKEIEALLNMENKPYALNILNEAELEIYRLYGLHSPAMARVSVNRSWVYGVVGQLRQSAKEYQQYVETNHYNYGYSNADTAVLYSAIIGDQMIRGNKNTADSLTVRMHNLFVADYSIAPGVRMNQAFVTGMAFLNNQCFDACEFHLNAAQRIYECELKPNTAILSEIAPLFHNGVVPESVQAIPYARMIGLAIFRLCLRKGMFDKAKEIIREYSEKETKKVERLKWQIHMGHILVIEGNEEEALQLWRNVIDKTPEAKKFEITKAIAEYAACNDLMDEAVKFYEEALQPETMVHGKTCDIAVVLKNYAAALELYDMEKKSEDMWTQAIMYMQSLDDKDGVALLYFSWSLLKQDHEEEELLKKAIQNWEREPYIHDETLSKMYYALCCAQRAQGKIDEARASAQKALDLFLGSMPPESLENLDLYF